MQHGQPPVAPLGSTEPIPTIDQPLTNTLNQPLINQQPWVWSEDVTTMAPVGSLESLAGCRDSSCCEQLPVMALLRVNHWLRVG